jgi:N-acyl homoserine lactone hydrolase
VYVQSAELRAARFPDLRTGTPNRALWDHPLDYQPIAGDTEIVPGVWAIATPGHTPGHQSLAVRLQETGLVILTGDAAYTWENVKQQRPSSNAWDLQLALESLRKLSAWERLAEVAIIPSHDPALWRWAHPHPFVYR